MIRAQQQASGSLSRLVPGLSALALGLGGVGLLAVSLLSVRERYSEIGLRLAVGGRPIAAARLANISLVARQVVEGVISGLHRSPHRGFSVEFSEHREYSPGDDLRHLDWVAWGRTDRYYLKQYEQETNLRAYVLLDVSASMNYRHGAELTKHEYGCFLTACLAYLMTRQQDMVGLVKIPLGCPAFAQEFLAHGLCKVLVLINHSRLKHQLPLLGTAQGRIVEHIVLHHQIDGLVVQVASEEGVTDYNGDFDTVDTEILWWADASVAAPVWIQVAPGFGSLGGLAMDGGSAAMVWRSACG